MQKTKFKIKGLHCHSCISLIKKELNNQSGIIKANLDVDSQKGVVIYDENKIQESEVYRLVEKSGDYQVEKINNEENKSDKHQRKENFLSIEKHRSQEEKIKKPSSKVYFLLGFLSSLAVLSLIANIIFISTLINLSARKSNFGQNEIAQAPNPSPSLQPPIPEAPAAIQSFEITKDNHVRGNFDAPITLVEFSSFECPFCARIQPTIEQILADYPNQVRHVYKHFPLPFQPNSFKAAEASECANEQGKFWEMHNEIYKAQPTGLSTEKFKEIAENLKLGTNQFNNCLSSGKYSQRVQADYDEGSQKGVQGTPATFVNGQLVSGALPYESFKQIIDSYLSK